LASGPIRRTNLPLLGPRIDGKRRVIEQ
jgi:hypothetical protein